MDTPNCFLKVKDLACTMLRLKETLKENQELIRKQGTPLLLLSRPSLIRTFSIRNFTDLKAPLNDIHSYFEVH